MAENMTVKIIGEFIDNISPSLSRLTTENIPQLIGALAGLAAVWGVEKLTEYVREAINVGDALNDLSERSGIAAESLSALSVAAKLGDVSASEMAVAFKKLSSSIVDAQDGTSKQATIFKTLGIAVKDANGQMRGTSDVMDDLADKFNKSANDANKVKIAMELMGKSGTQMITVLNGGKEALDAYKKLGETLGLAWTGEQTAQAGRFNDAMDTLSMTFDGFWQIIAKNLLPKLMLIAEYFAESAKEGGLLRGVLDGMAILISGPVGAALDFLATIGSTIAFAFNVAGKSIGGVAAGLVAMLSGDFKVAKAIMAEMDRDIKKQFEDYKTFNEKVWTPHVPGKKEGDKPSIGPDGTAAAKQADEFAKALAALQKELYAANSAGKEIEVTWQTIHGEFKKFTATQKQILINKAAEIDITKQLLDLENARVRTESERDRKQTQAWINNAQFGIKDKNDREGWLAAENQKIAKMAEFDAKEKEIRKLGPQAQEAGLAQLNKDRESYGRGGSEYKAEFEVGKEISATNQKAQIWQDTIIKNADAYQKLKVETEQFALMLKVGDITLEQYTEMMNTNRRATEDLNASQTRATLAYAEVTLVQARAVEDLKLREEAINKAYADGNLTLAEKKMKLKEVKDEMDSMSAVHAVDQVQQLQDSVTSATASFEGMFSDYIFSAMEGKWQNLGDMVRKVISQMVAQMIAAKIQMALFGDLGSTPSGKTAASTGLIGAGFGALFGGFREAGGPVEAGKSYIVGEKRPEVFTPSVNGTIAASVDKVSSGALGGQNMQINISALDGSDVMKVLSSKKREIASMMNNTNRNYNLG